MGSGEPSRHQRCLGTAGGGQTSRGGKGSGTSHWQGLGAAKGKRGRKPAKAAGKGQRPTPSLRPRTGPAALPCVASPSRRCWGPLCPLAWAPSQHSLLGCGRSLAAFLCVAQQGPAYLGAGHHSTGRRWTRSRSAGAAPQGEGQPRLGCWPSRGHLGVGGRVRPGREAGDEYRLP